LAHAYFGRLYFSKFFGGKIENFSTELIYSKYSEKSFKKTARAYFGGKIKKKLNRVCQKLFYSRVTRQHSSTNTEAKKIKNKVGKTQILLIFSLR